MEFVCDNCGVFLNSVDGTMAVCKCDGKFHEPKEAPHNEVELFPGESGTEDAAETVEEKAVEIDFNDPDCKKCDFKTRAQDVQAAMLRHYAGHESD